MATFFEFTYIFNQKNKTKNKKTTQYITHPTDFPPTQPYLGYIRHQRRTGGTALHHYKQCSGGDELVCHDLVNSPLTPKASLPSRTNI
jgi:hypothetical protein